MPLKLSDDDTDKLVDILAATAANALAIGPQGYFRDLVSRTSLPPKLKQEFAGVWTGSAPVDARALVNWALTKPVNPVDPRYTIIGSFLKELLEDVDLIAQRWIASLILANDLYIDPDLKSQLRAAYSIPEKAGPLTIGAMSSNSGSLPSTMNIPGKAYHEFIGRQDKIDEIMNILREPKRKAMIAVFGLGGIGKTALAREVVERCREDRSFKCIVWISFKTEQFVGERITQIADPKYSFEEVLSDIGRQCTSADKTELSQDPKQAMDITSMTPAKRKEAVTSLLTENRVLIVLDNLETLVDSDDLVFKIFEILGQSKLLITSRHEVIDDRVRKINLGGFSEDEGVAFLRAESKERGINTVATAQRSQLVKIQHVTGGVPLAMKLVIGQMSRQPMEVVLKTLQEASFTGQDYDLYRFIYRYSWNMLDMNARKVLVDMSVFPPLKGGAARDVESVSQVNGSDFWSAMDLLVRLSLVDKIGRAGMERFALHPLTQNFIRSDITKEKEWAQ